MKWKPRFLTAEEKSFWTTYRKLRGYTKSSFEHESNIAKQKARAFLDNSTIAAVIPPWIIREFPDLEEYETARLKAQRITTRHNRPYAQRKQTKTPERSRRTDGKGHEVILRLVSLVGSFPEKQDDELFGWISTEALREGAMMVKDSSVHCAISRFRRQFGYKIQTKNVRVDWLPPTEKALKRITVYRIEPEPVQRQLTYRPNS